jgi:hypothetical protein
MHTSRNECRQKQANGAVYFSELEANVGWAGRQ